MPFLNAPYHPGGKLKRGCGPNVGRLVCAFGRTYPLAEESGVDVKQQETSLKALACLAWADGSLSVEEKDKLIEMVGALGMTIDKQTVASLIDSSRVITPEILTEAKAIPFELFASLLVLALEIAGVNDGISTEEQEAIGKIANLHLDTEKTKKLFKWFATKKIADQLFDEIFDSAI